MLEGLDQMLNGRILPFLLLGAGLFYAARLRFFHLRKLSVIWRVLTRSQQKGGVSPFRSLTLALAGTLGVGNIVGVAYAIALGGAGAVLWMWVSAFAAMLLKYAEVVLGLRYRKREGDTWHGGAPYYIKEGLSRRGMGRLGAALAAVFAVFSFRCALFGCVSIFFFNMTMPLTLSRITAHLRPAPGFAFGFLMFCLFIGILPTLVFGIRFALSPVGLAMLCLLSMALLYADERLGGQAR